MADENGQVLSLEIDSESLEIADGKLKVKGGGSVDLAAAIHAAEAASPADADEVGFWQSVGAALRKVTFANLWQYVKGKADQVYAALNHTHTGYLTTETDPVYGASPAAGISSGDISTWNAKQPAGDYSTIRSRTHMLLNFDCTGKTGAAGVVAALAAGLRLEDANDGNFDAGNNCSGDLVGVFVASTTVNIESFGNGWRLHGGLTGVIQGAKYYIIFGNIIPLAMLGYIDPTMPAPSKNGVSGFYTTLKNGPTETTTWVTDLEHNIKGDLYFIQYFAEVDGHQEWPMRWGICHYQIPVTVKVGDFIQLNASTSSYNGVSCFVDTDDNYLAGLKGSAFLPGDVWQRTEAGFEYIGNYSFLNPDSFLTAIPYFIPSINDDSNVDVRLVSQESVSTDASLGLDNPSDLLLPTQKVLHSATKNAVYDATGFIPNFMSLSLTTKIEGEGGAQLEPAAFITAIRAWASDHGYSTQFFPDGSFYLQFMTADSFCTDSNGYPNKSADPEIGDVHYCDKDGGWTSVGNFSYKGKAIPFFTFGLAASCQIGTDPGTVAAGDHDHSGAVDTIINARIFLAVKGVGNLPDEPEVGEKWLTTNDSNPSLAEWDGEQWVYTLASSGTIALCLTDYNIYGIDQHYGTWRALIPLTPAAIGAAPASSTTWYDATFSSGGSTSTVTDNKVSATSLIDVWPLGAAGVQKGQWVAVASAGSFTITSYTPGSSTPVNETSNIAFKWRIAN